MAIKGVQEVLFHDEGPHGFSFLWRMTLDPRFPATKVRNFTAEDEAGPCRSSVSPDGSEMEYTKQLLLASVPRAQDAQTLNNCSLGAS